RTSTLSLHDAHELYSVASVIPNDADWHRHPGTLRRSDPIQREPKGGSAVRGLAQERVERRPSKCGRGLHPLRTPWGCERPDCVRCETRRHIVLEGMNPVAWRKQMPGICHRQELGAFYTAIPTAVRNSATRARQSN